MEDSSILTKRKHDNPEREDEDTLSKKELLTKKLINALYESNIQNPKPEKSFLNVLELGFNIGIHSTENDTTKDEASKIQDYINFIIDKIIHTGMTFNALDKYNSAIHILVKLIIAISVKLNIPLNNILGVIVFGHGHGGFLTISPEDNTKLNASVNLVEHLPVVAEQTYGYEFTFNVGRDLAEKYYERKGKSLSRKDKECYRNYCYQNYLDSMREKTNNIKIIEKFKKKLISLKNSKKKDLETKKQELRNICQDPITKVFCEKSAENQSIPNIYIETDDFITNYERFIKKADEDIQNYNELFESDTRSLNTSRMMKLLKSTSNKEQVCEKIQLLSSGKNDGIYANIYTLFYVLPEFSKSYPKYANLIDLMLNRVMAECRARRKPLKPRDNDTQHQTIFEKTLQDNTDTFYDFAIFKHQEKIDLNISGFSLQFLLYLDHTIARIKGVPNKLDLKNIFQMYTAVNTVFLNPAKFMIILGEIVPQITTTYIYNACRRTIIDNPDVIVSSSAETTPSSTPRSASSTLGGSRRRKHRYSTRHKQSNKSYRKYSIGNGRQYK
jgi:hypothetical protein